MAYRDDLDAFSRRRARDDDEAALLASFHHGERVRRKRALATWLGGFAVVLGAICAWPSAQASPARHEARVAAMPPRPVSDADQAERRACLRQAVRDYRRYLAIPQQSSLGLGGPDITVEQLARDCVPGSR